MEPHLEGDFEHTRVERFYIITSNPVFFVGRATLWGVKMAKAAHCLP